MIELDGSHGEGGGQMLRTALGLSVITQKPFKIVNIRKGRSEPGLKAQHMSCIKACAEFCNAEVKGNTIGSDFVEFTPKVIKNRQMEISIGTAGSISLLLQSVLLPIIFTESEIKIIGGTDVKWSMPIDYFIGIIRPLILHYSNLEINCEKRGYFPVGGGVVVVKNKPKYKRIDFDTFEKFHQYIFGNPAIDFTHSGEVLSIKGVSHASMDLSDKKVAERQAGRADVALSSFGKVNILRQYSKTESTGSGILLYATFSSNNKQSQQYRIGTDVLGEKGLKAEEVGRIASDKLISMIKKKVIVDDCMQDNIIPLLGLFGGRIRTGKLTDHTKSNIYVCEKFLDVKYEIKTEYEDYEDYEDEKENGSENKEKKSNQKENQNEANLISVLSSKIS